MLARPMPDGQLVPSRCTPLEDSRLRYMTYTLFGNGSNGMGLYQSFLKNLQIFQKLKLSLSIAVYLTVK